MTTPTKDWAIHFRSFNHHHSVRFTSTWTIRLLTAQTKMKHANPSLKRSGVHRREKELLDGHDDTKRADCLEKHITKANNRQTMKCKPPSIHAIALHLETTTFLQAFIANAQLRCRHVLQRLNAGIMSWNRHSNKVSSPNVVNTSLWIKDDTTTIATTHRTENKITPKQEMLQPRSAEKQNLNARHKTSQSNWCECIATCKHTPFCHNAASGCQSNFIDFFLLISGNTDLNQWHALAELKTTKETAIIPEIKRPNAEAWWPDIRWMYSGSFCHDKLWQPWSSNERLARSKHVPHYLRPESETHTELTLKNCKSITNKTKHAFGINYWLNSCIA